MGIVEIRPEVHLAPVETVGAAPPGLAQPAGLKMAQSVSEIVAGARDSGGETIDSVYFKRRQYAIYRRGTPAQVVVAYSDEDLVADQQIAQIGGLLALRERLLRLTGFLPSKMQEHYRVQLADALRLGLEKQVPAAQALLAEATDEALATQGRRGRLVYLQWTGTAIAPALLLILFGGYYVEGRIGVHLLLMSIGAGAIGAVMSIAIGIRARTVAIDGDWRSNAVDAAVRVGIGMISAGVLFLLLNSGIVSTISAGGIALNGSAMSWQVTLIIGFAAGFLERLVPDLLERTVPASKSAAPGGAGAPPAQQ
jgi:hypothetical protein